MKNLLRAEIYKLKQSKLAMGFLLLGFAMSLFIIYGIFWDRANGAYTPNNLREGIMLSTIIHYVLVGIFTALVVAGEFENGLIRNALCLGKSRVKIYLSRLFSVSLLSLVMFTLYSMGVLIIVGCMEGFASINWLTTLTYWLILLPYYLAVAATFTLIAFVAKQSANDGRVFDIRRFYFLFPRVI